MPPEYTLIQAIELFRIYRAQKNVINKNHTWLDKYSPQNSKNIIGIIIIHTFYLIR